MVFLLSHEQCYYFLYYTFKLPHIAIIESAKHLSPMNVITTISRRRIFSYFLNVLLFLYVLDSFLTILFL